MRGGTLIEINLDIYSRQSAGYIGHCTSINAPTYLQLQPRDRRDITFELIIHDRGMANDRSYLHFCFRVYVPWVDTEEPCTRFVIYGVVLIQKFPPLSYSSGTKICRNYPKIRSRFTVAPWEFPSYTLVLNTILSTGINWYFTPKHCWLVLLKLGCFWPVYNFGESYFRYIITLLRIKCRFIQ